MGITTTPELESYLRSAGIEYDSVEPLSGGTANFVWRLALPSGETRVVKHAEPYIKNVPSFAFDADRIHFEGSALSLIPQALSSIQPTPTAPTVRIPTLHHSDPDAHILIMSDGGPLNLKAWYPTAPATLIPLIGASLGTWLAHLHHRTRSLRTTDSALARTIYRHAYANLAAAFRQYSLDTALAAAIDDEFGAKLATDDACVCHGDFWPGNVLVKDGGEDEGAGTVLSVVDWEMTRRGVGATDVAQFAAEAWLLDRFRGGKGLLAAFLETYVRVAKELGGVPGGTGKEEYVRRLVVHFGVHLAFWPTRVEWCGEEETGGLVRMGKEYIVAGRGMEWDTVRQGPLAPVFGLLD